MLSHKEWSKNSFHKNRVSSRLLIKSFAVDQLCNIQKTIKKKSSLYDLYKLLADLSSQKPQIHRLTTFKIKFE